MTFPIIVAEIGSATTVINAFELSPAPTSVALGDPIIAEGIKRGQRLYHSIAGMRRYPVGVLRF